MRMTPIKVRAYSGYRAEEKPRAFEYEGRLYIISQITHQSIELQAGGRLLRRFRVRADGGEFDLAYDEEWGDWFLLG